MKRILFVFAGFMMALAIVAAAPGTAGAVAFDVGSAYNATLPVNSTNYINVTANGSTISLAGEADDGPLGLHVN